MKGYLLSTAVIALLLASTSSCGRRNEAKERVQAEREKWEASLPDSLKAVETQRDSITQEIERLGNSVNEMLPQFKYVDNPREVEGYYMASGWTGSYPLSKTGLVARLTKGEKLELIADLAGGGYFNSIRVQTEETSAESSVVPHDQALNYRMSGLNTVCFSDSAAQECARVIAESPSSIVKIIYLNDGKQTGTLAYPAKDCALMRETWNLFDARSRMTHDERMLPLVAKKAALIQDRIQRLEEKNKK